MCVASSCWGMFRHREPPVYDEVHDVVCICELRLVNVIVNGIRRVASGIRLR